LIAGTARKGLHAASNNPPDLIILDLTLPEIDGLRVLREIRSDGIEVKVLALTARVRKRTKCAV
jgi:DNA-binding response OmpR family regulator